MSEIKLNETAQEAMNKLKEAQSTAKEEKAQKTTDVFMQGVENKLALLSEDEVEQLFRVRDAIKSLKETESKLSDNIKEKLDDAGVKNAHIGAYDVSRGKDSITTSVDGKRLKTERPEIFAEFSKVGSRRGAIKVKKL